MAERSAAGATADTAAASVKVLRRSRIASRVPRNVTGVLLEFGMDYRRRPNNPFPRKQLGFWGRHQHELHSILFEAHKQYRKLAKQWHNRAGRCEQELKRLNCLWTRTKRLFKTQGIELHS